MDPPRRPLNTSPQTDANCCSRATFWWMNKLLRLAHERHLEENDLNDVITEDSSVTLANNLDREWEKEVYKSKTGGKPSLRAALHRCYGNRIITIGIAFFFVDREVFRITQAILLGLLVSYFEDDTDVPWEHAYIYAGAWTLCYILVIFLDNLAFHQCYHFGLKMRVSCTSLIYRKLLRLSYHSLQDITSGKIVSLLSTDAQKFDRSCLGINYIWIGPIETVVILLILWIYLGLGATSLLGLAALGILSPVQFLLGRFLARMRVHVSHLTDRRVRGMSEIISSIRSIKINCWEKPFSTLINSIRKSEWTYLRVMSHIRSVHSALYFVSGKLLMFVTFLTYVMLGGQSAASTVFTVLGLYEILRTSVSLLLPWGVQHYMEANVAVLNIQTYLLLEEKVLVDVTCQTTANNTVVKRTPLPKSVSVKFDDYSAAWGKDDQTYTLEGVDLTIKKGKYVAITGPAASGKSSFLLAITGELPRLGGSVRTRGRLGLVGQQPWLYPGTVRDNILYGSELDRRKYNRVLHACGLLQDIESFDNADLSMVGERGVKLTDGQKLKISLARVVYQNCDIYLVDDIFTHMDDKSAIHIFSKCFCGLISTKTLVLVSQNIKFLKAADEIVVLEKGRISHHGGYNDIQNQGVELEKLVFSYHINQDILDGEDNNEDDEEGQSVACDIYSSQMSVVRQRSGLDSSYGSSESLDQVLLEYDQGCSDTDVADEDVLLPGSWLVYLRYLYLAGGSCVGVLFCVVCGMAHVAYVLCDWWLYIWITKQNNSTRTTPDNITGIFPASPSPIPHIFPFPLHPVTPVDDLYIYVGLFLALLVLGIIRSTIFSALSVHVSKTLHQRVFSKVMRIPLTYFEKHSPGQVLNRFGRDIGYIDDSLPAGYFDCVQFVFMLVCTCVVTSVTNYWLVLVVVPMVLLFLVIRYYYISAAREVRKLEMAAKVPVYTHLSNTVSGMWTIRALGSEDRCLRTFDTYQDRHTSACYTYLAIQRWFALRLDVVSIVAAALVVFVCVSLKHMVDPGLMGMTLAYTLNTMGLFQYSSRQSAELEQQMSGLEQLLGFKDLTEEADLVTDNRPSPSWPMYGIITFEGYTVTGHDGCKQLRNMWGCIRAEEKVGILSHREGSKAALVSAILRLVEPQHGIVRIDGQDLSEIGLQDIRERVTVVSQDPVIFAGTLRRNMDPFTRYPDANLWKVLEEVGLKVKAETLPGKLYSDMGEYRENFSLGERQLLGLARALLQNSKIVIFEESSSVIDKYSESVIQHVLNSKMPNKTVIIIAQRIHTVIAMDRVMVLDEGKIKDFDPPHQMLQNKLGYFYRFACVLPEAEIRLLRKVARDKFENRPYRPPTQLELEEGVATAGRTARHFLPSFQSTRLTGVLSHFTGNRFSTNIF